MICFKETLHLHWTQFFKALKVVYHRSTSIQEVTIFETTTFGKVLVLDGVIQTTEADEFHYHEMMVHVPLLAHGAVQTVCVVGGGDGGILREILKHPCATATLVEIDSAIVEISRTHLANISAGALDNPRVTIVVADGCQYLADSDELFDVIIVDSTDPSGHALGLFEETFYRNCQKRLRPGGILVTQSGVPFLQPEETHNSYQRLKSHFADVWFFVTSVPTYIGGLMALGWASSDQKYRTLPVELIRERSSTIHLDTRYYTPEVHVASFALPRYVERLLY